MIPVFISNSAFPHFSAFFLYRFLISQFPGLLQHPVSPPRFDLSIPSADGQGLTAGFGGALFLNGSFKGFITTTPL
jgi:hypothetical protein